MKTLFNFFRFLVEFVVLSTIVLPLGGLSLILKFGSDLLESGLAIILDYMDFYGHYMEHQMEEDYE